MFINSGEPVEGRVKQPKGRGGDEAKPWGAGRQCRQGEFALERRRHTLSSEAGGVGGEVGNLKQNRNERHSGCVRVSTHQLSLLVKSRSQSFPCARETNVLRMKRVHRT